MSEQEDIKQEAEAMRHSVESLMMATVNADCNPEISYAPYIEQDGCFYIFISELAAHTRHLLHNGKVSVLFIEDESNANNTFARKRQTFTCQSGQIPRDAHSFSSIMDKMQNRFGNLIETLLTLKDFHLFELKPIKGQYVAGFGKTYQIDVNTGKYIFLTADKLKK